MTGRRRLNVKAVQTDRRALTEYEAILFDARREMARPTYRAGARVAAPKVRIPATVPPLRRREA